MMYKYSKAQLTLNVVYPCPCPCPCRSPYPCPSCRPPIAPITSRLIIKSAAMLDNQTNSNSNSNSNSITLLIGIFRGPC